MADTESQWVPHAPEPAPQTLLPFLDRDDTITTSQAARLLEMSSENVRVLAKSKVLKPVLVVAGQRFYSRRAVLALKSERDVFALWTSQRTTRIRMPYAAYRSGR